MQHVLTIEQFKQPDIERVLELSGKMEGLAKNGKQLNFLNGKIVASVFFEASTRTRLSFESAVIRLGGNVISSENAFENSSAKKGESLVDTVKILECYADLLVIRHPESGSVEKAASFAKKPIINAGDGGNQHPTQALLDAYSIYKNFGRLDHLTIAMGFDPLHSRTIRSLSQMLSQFPNNKIIFVCREKFNPHKEFLEKLKNSGTEVEITQNMNIFGKVDIFYANRFQRERFTEQADFEIDKEELKISFELATKSPKTIILDPLPRIGEIDLEVDMLPNAKYFEQAQNGVYVRMALLKMLLT